MTNAVPIVPVDAIDIPLQAALWTVTGNEPGQLFTFHYCCRGGGVAETPVELPSGHWLVRVQQTSDECYQAVHPAISWGADKFLSTPPASTEQWAVSLVDVPDGLSEVPLRLRIFVEGGFSCCGTTSLDKVELVRGP